MKDNSPAPGSVPGSSSTGAVVFYLKRQVVFPHSRVTVTVPLSETSRHLKKGDNLVSCPVTTMADLIPLGSRTGTLCQVTGMTIKNASVVLNLSGLSRVRINMSWPVTQSPWEKVTTPEHEINDSQEEQLRRKTQELIFLINVKESDRLIGLLPYLTLPGQLSDFTAHYFITSYRKRVRLLRQTDPTKRNVMLLKFIETLLKKISIKLNDPTKSPIIKEASELIDKMNRPENYS